MASKIRLYVDHDLGAGQSVLLTKEQAHYLFGVMRKGVDEVLSLFNGRDGEWDARVVEAGKRKGILVCEAQTKPLQLPPDVWLMFAPIKKARTDFIVEKATEMGAARIMPVQTEFTNSDRVRHEKLVAHAVEAAEQCGVTYVPPVDPLAKLTKVLAAWPEDRKLLFCDEALVGAQAVFAEASHDKWAILIGPEGGFSHAERELLGAKPYVTQASLGPRILRADTAAVAALTLWQTTQGDW
ncbi:MAG: 16S rRNA (uracil(1498)-N(3))-methyltransferase [Paracoccaceae bacterium]|nr:16S rRNA (uracil(1498)-N(3))-methyltransferase [Paracoccaceae bacterium]